MNSRYINPKNVNVSSAQIVDITLARNFHSHLSLSQILTLRGAGGGAGGARMAARTRPPPAAAAGCKLDIAGRPAERAGSAAGSLGWQG